MFEDAVYHVASRGNRGQEIFLDNSDRSFFLNLVGKASERFQLRVFAFCLMSNHYHLFLQTPLPNLSQSMHWLNCSYASHFAWRHDVPGHLFQGRYKSVLSAEEVHFLHLSMYLHLNPVRALMAEDPDEYRWSSFRDYVNPKPRYPWLAREEILAHYGATARECSRRYREECLGLIGAKPDFIAQLKSGSVVGSSRKLEQLARKYRPAGRIQNVPAYLDATKKEIDPARELARVALIFNVAARDLTLRKRNFHAKFAAYYHLTHHCRLSVTQTAEMMQVGVPAVSLGIKTLLELASKNPRLRKQISELTNN